MRLLHVIRSVDPAGGGPLEVIRQFSTAHLAEGHHVEVVSLDLPDQVFNGELGVPTHHLGTNKGSYGYSTRLIPWLRTQGKDFDAVIVHGLWQYHGMGTRTGLCGTGVPYFVFPHGMLDPWFRQAYLLKHLKKALYWRLIEHRVLRDARAVLFTGEEEHLLAQQTFRPYRCTERIAPLGIQSPEGNPSQQQAAFLDAFPVLREQRYLLFLGRIHDKKGCDLLIRAYAGIANQSAESAPPLPHLVIAGPCRDSAYLEKLRTLARTSGLEVLDETLTSSRNLAQERRAGAVHFLPMLVGDLKWGAFHSADAFILPSHQENFGIAIAEALACSLPVLISDKVNIWREIEACRGGLVETDDLPGTIRLLSRWFAMSTDERLLMRGSARWCFTEQFEIGRAAAHLEEMVTERIRIGCDASSRGVEDRSPQ